ncbi:MAG: hypothetical protein V2I63_03190, partial [Pseudomonadales bacterium]|nr:hypothetical protein [Pseudomonadales bacterium]
KSVASGLAVRLGMRTGQDSGTCRATMPERRTGIEPWRRKDDGGGGSVVITHNGLETDRAITL